MSYHKWVLTLDPEDGSDKKYGVALELGPDPDPETLGTLVAETVEKHTWVDPTTAIPHTARIIVLLISEQGEKNVLEKDFPISAADRTDKFQALCTRIRTDVLGVLK